MLSKFKGFAMPYSSIACFTGRYTSKPATSRYDPFRLWHAVYHAGYMLVTVLYTHALRKLIF